MVQVSDENCKAFWSMLSGRVRKIPPPSPPLSKDEVHWAYHEHRKSNLVVNSIMVSIVLRQILLQNATAILLQNVTEVYYKMRHFY